MERLSSFRPSKKKDAAKQQTNVRRQPNWKKTAHGFHYRRLCQNDRYQTEISLLLTTERRRLVSMPKQTKDGRTCYPKGGKLSRHVFRQVFNFAVAKHLLAATREQWRESMLFLLYKGKGSKMDPSNYRGVSLGAETVRDTRGAQAK